MTTATEAQALLDWLQPLLPAYLEELRRLCAIDSPTSDKAGVDEAGAWMRAWAEGRGWEVRTWADETTGDSVVVTVPGGRRDGPLVLLAAHLDTVYPLGTAAERPVQIEGDVVLGPGTADNKSGLLSGLYALAVLQELDLLGSLGGVTLVGGGDEETNMRSSLALLTEIAPAYDAALVLECGRENGDIVSARKGAGHFRLVVHGRQAHAGVEPHLGANAVAALAQQVLALQLLNGVRPGTTVNVGVIGGGTRVNVVPDEAWADVDVRVAAPEDLPVVEEAIARIAGTPYVAGTTAEITGRMAAPPMACTPAIAALADLARVCAAELGFTLRDAATGGVSYANRLAALALPVLDGLGPVGGQDHSPREYILASSIVPRTALLALLIRKIGEMRGEWVSHHN